MLLAAQRSIAHHRIRIRIRNPGHEAIFWRSAEIFLRLMRQFSAHELVTYG
jgi:hypothetical protein